MVCPFRKETKTLGVNATEKLVVQEFAKCQGADCPYFFVWNGEGGVTERCKRVEGVK